MVRAYSTNGAEEECIYDFGGKTKRKETTRKPRLMWINNIKMVLRDGLIWTGLIWLGIGTSGRLL
jgi:hypothetical protein